MLNPADFKTTNPLDSVSIRYANEQTDFIADNIFHPMPVPKSDFKVWQYDTSNYRYVSSKKSSKAEADTIDYSGFYTSKKAELRKLKGMIDPADERDFDAVVGDVEEDTAMSVMDRLLIDKEVDAATLCNTTTNYPSDLTSTLGSTATWASDGGDPEADARTARVAVKARCGKAANALALSWTAFEYLKTSAALKDRVKYTSGQSLSEEQIKNILQVQYLFICKAQKNTNVEGNATQTLSDIWNDSALFFVYDPAPRRKKVCYGIQGIRNEVKSRVFNDEKLGSGDGPVRFVETSWWYNLSAGAVVSSSDSDFAAGYCLANVY